METDRKSIEELVTKYRPEVEKLIPYLSWLQEQRGKELSSTYGGKGIKESSIVFPVYDGTLMNFVKVAGNTVFMDRNYVYVYSRNRIRNAEDERAFIKKAELKDMHDLGCILSNYILKGRTKTTMWTEGVKNGIYLELITKMRDLIVFWDKPMY